MNRHMQGFTARDTARLSFTADDACRLALGAFYSARSAQPAVLDDPAQLIGDWMLHLSQKLDADAKTQADYREIIGRWEGDDNPPVSAQFATQDNAADNGPNAGADNGR